MPLKASIDNDIKAALLGGDRFVAQTLRGIKAVILNEEVSQGKRDTGLDDAVIETLLRKEVKKRHEAAATYDDANRTDLAEAERAEADIIGKYLPAQLSEQAVQKAVDDIIDELGMSDASAMGQVMGAVKQKLGSTADGATVAKFVRDRLTR